MSSQLRRIGKYQLIDQIGVGGFGEVFKGFDPYIKRPVAIKTCTSRSDEIRSRFFKEAEIAGNLHHRNITTVYDFGVEGDLPYLIQEYLSGEDLDAKIKRKDFLPWAEKLLYLIQIARGLAYAHEKGVIHRDIKPANVRVLDDGTTKIMDFGIAKLAQQESGLTQTGMTLGTAAYLSPEQIRGATVDCRSDIFSFGVLAYELLTYQRPFQGEQISAVLYQLLNNEPRPVVELWPAAPPEIAELVRRCLDKKAAKRFADGGELLVALEKIQTDTRDRSGIYGQRPDEGADGPTVPLDSGPLAARAEIDETTDMEVPVAASSGSHPSPAATSASAPESDSAPRAWNRRSLTGLDDLELTATGSHPRQPGRPAAPPPATSTSGSFAVATGSSSRAALWIVLVVLLGAAAGAGWWLGVERPDSSGAGPDPGRSSADSRDGTAPGIGAEGVNGAAARAASDGTRTPASSSPPAGSGSADTRAADTGPDGTDSAGATTATTDTEAVPEAPAKGKILIRPPGWTVDMTVRLGNGANRALDRARSFDLAPGRYSLTFAVDHRGYRQSRTVEVDLEAGATERIAPPIAQPGSLTVRPFPRRPQGEIRLDGEEVGPSPLRDRPLAPGRHVVEVRPRSGEGSPISQLVEIESGKETIVTFDLETGNMRVTNKAPS